VTPPVLPRPAAHRSNPAIGGVPNPAREETREEHASPAFIHCDSSGGREDRPALSGADQTPSGETRRSDSAEIREMEGGARMAANRTGLVEILHVGRRCPHSPRGWRYGSRRVERRAVHKPALQMAAMPLDGLGPWTRREPSLQRWDDPPKGRVAQGLVSALPEGTSPG